MKLVAKDVTGSSQEISKFERVDPPASLVFGGLKLADHLGSVN
jgi:hypothetical protein